MDLNPYAPDRVDEPVEAGEGAAEAAEADQDVTPAEDGHEDPADVE